MPAWALAVIAGLAVAAAIAAPSGLRLLLEVHEDRKRAKAEAEWAHRQRRAS
jgi:hypothetical protein